MHFKRARYTFNRGNTIENRGCLLLASERSERDSIRGG